MVSKQEAVVHTTIIKRKKIVKAAGHHGGAWKVAYADFVTAMMAFFLLMWLINTTSPEQKRGIADYFAPASVSETTSGAGGILAGTAAWRDSDLWLHTLRNRLDVLREDLADLLATHLPRARMRPLEATYLAWLDLRAYDVADPAAAGLEHGVMAAAGHDYHPGLDGHVRLNIATSADRLAEIVRRLGAALT